MNKYTSILAFLSIALCSGCASIVSDSKYPVTITSSPEGAQYTLKNEKGITVAKGTTPDTVYLTAKSGFFRGASYQIDYEKEDYEPKLAVLDSDVDLWYFGNIIFGGLIGMLIVDPATGAMWELPEHVSANLSPLPASTKKTKSPNL